MPIYTQQTAFADTQISDYYLDLMVNRPIPKIEDDAVFEITQTYQYRPDLLAYDLYNNSELWWVFAQRNPDTLKNPLLDFAIGTQIFLPKLETLRSTLGF